MTSEWLRLSVLFFFFPEKGSEVVLIPVTGTTALEGPCFLVFLQQKKKDCLAHQIIRSGGRKYILRGTWLSSSRSAEKASELPWVGEAARWPDPRSLAEAGMNHIPRKVQRKCNSKVWDLKSFNHIAKWIIEYICCRTTFPYSTVFFSCLYNVLFAYADLVTKKIIQFYRS